MRLIIELLTRANYTGDARDDSYVALANYDGELLSKAGVGAGGTQRQAAQEAINSLFTRREAEAALSASQALTLRDPVITLHAAPAPGAGSLLNQRRETERDGIIQLARQAIAADPTPRLTLHYEDGEGRETVRDIYPSEVREAPSPTFLAPRYLIAVDVEKDEPRTFLIERITMLRTPEPAR